MQLKIYRAPDLATALEQARAEMGPDALVLGSTEHPGRFGLSMVEVTVGVNRTTTNPTIAQDTASQQLAREIEQVRRENARRPVEQPRPAPRSAPSFTTNSATSSATSSAPSRDQKSWTQRQGIQATVRLLLASGLSRDAARRFADSALPGLPPTPGPQALAEASARGFDELLAFAPTPIAHQCTFVVGPPGCGKTTTVAKLVAHASKNTERPVVFATTDRYRVGSHEQADIFTRCMGVRGAHIEHFGDLSTLLRESGEHGAVFVDTPGIGAGDSDRLQELAELRRLIPGAAVALLLPAGVHRREALRILDRFTPIEPTCVGFSRVDDCALPGELVTAVASRELPLAFFTNGPSVPDDLEAASPRSLAALLLRAGSGAISNPEVQYP